jgi:hypothetical protein
LAAGTNAGPEYCTVIWTEPAGRVCPALGELIVSVAPAGCGAAAVGGDGDATADAEGDGEPNAAGEADGLLTAAAAEGAGETATDGDGDALATGEAAGLVAAAVGGGALVGCAGAAGVQATTPRIRTGKTLTSARWRIHRIWPDCAAHHPLPAGCSDTGESRQWHCMTLRLDRGLCD